MTVFDVALRAPRPRPLSRLSPARPTADVADIEVELPLRCEAAVTWAARREPRPAEVHPPDGPSNPSPVRQLDRSGRAVWVGWLVWDLAAGTWTEGGDR
jgi:hypothetical protein